MSDCKAPPSESEVQNLVGDAYSRFVTFADRVREDLGSLTLDWKSYKLIDVKLQSRK